MRKPKFPGQIKALAAKDIDAAYLAARIGAVLSEIQTHLFYYYHYQADIHRVKSGEQSAALPLMEATAIRWGGNAFSKEDADFFHRRTQKMADDKAAELCRIFINAVNEGDSKKIIEIGNAIEYLRILKQKGTMPDNYRAEILELKQRLDRTGEKWPIRKVAQWIGWPEMSGADGFKQVRDMCEELKFPIAKLKQR